VNDIYITLTGNVAAEPRQHTFEDGIKVTSLRVLTSHRYFDKKSGQWVDGERVCFAVRCWRTLGDNVAQSIRVGHPVVVSGKLRIREFGPDDDRRFMAEVEASSVGHDLRWGTGSFAKPDRAALMATRERRDRLDEETQDWAMGRVRVLGGGAARRELTSGSPTFTRDPAEAPDAGWYGDPAEPAASSGVAGHHARAHGGLSGHGGVPEHGGVLGRDGVLGQDGVRWRTDGEVVAEAWQLEETPGARGGGSSAARSGRDDPDTATKPDTRPKPGAVAKPGAGPQSGSDAKPDASAKSGVEVRSGTSGQNPEVRLDSTKKSDAGKKSARPPKPGSPKEGMAEPERRGEDDALVRILGAVDGGTPVEGGRVAA
jgi:single-strand DNA-binding protein